MPQPTANYSAIVLAVFLCSRLVVYETLQRQRLFTLPAKCISRRTAHVVPPVVSVVISAYMYPYLYLYLYVCLPSLYLFIIAPKIIQFAHFQQTSAPSIDSSIERSATQKIFHIFPHTLTHTHVYLWPDLAFTYSTYMQRFQGVSPSSS